jgi:hypothetical protein
LSIHQCIRLGKKERGMKNERYSFISFVQLLHSLKIEAWNSFRRISSLISDLTLRIPQCVTWHSRLDRIGRKCQPTRLVIKNVALFLFF